MWPVLDLKYAYLKHFTYFQVVKNNMQVKVQKNHHLRYYVPLNTVFGRVFKVKYSPTINSMNSPTIISMNFFGHMIVTIVEYFLPLL